MVPQDSGEPNSPALPVAAPVVERKTQQGALDQVDGVPKIPFHTSGRPSAVPPALGYFPKDDRSDNETDGRPAKSFQET